MSHLKAETSAKWFVLSTSIAILYRLEVDAVTKEPSFRIGVEDTIRGALGWRQERWGSRQYSQISLLDPTPKGAFSLGPQIKLQSGTRPGLLPWDWEAARSLGQEGRSLATPLLAVTGACCGSCPLPGCRVPWLRVGLRDCEHEPSHCPQPLCGTSTVYPLSTPNHTWHMLDGMAWLDLFCWHTHFPSIQAPNGFLLSPSGSLLFQSCHIWKLHRGWCPPSALERGAHGFASSSLSG